MDDESNTADWERAMREHDYDRAVELAETDADASRLVRALCRLGASKASAGRTEAAEAALRRAIQIADAQLAGADPRWRVYARLEADDFLRGKNRYPEAIGLCREALALAQAVWGADDPRTARALVALGYALHEGDGWHDQGLREIEPLYRGAIALLDGAPALDPDLGIRARRLLRGLLLVAERSAEAAIVTAQIEALDSGARGGGTTTPSSASCSADVAASEATTRAKPASERAAERFRHATFGDAWLIRRVDHKLVLRFDDGKERTIDARFVTAISDACGAADDPG